MRYFRRLPPLLRVASILGRLLFLAAFVLLGSTMLSTAQASFRWGSAVDATRVLVIALSLGTLGGACIFAVNVYSKRFRRPDGGPFLLESWQSQVRATALLAVLPLGALAVALLLPPGSSVEFLALLITCVAANVLVVAYVRAAADAPGSIPT